ncbi:hypothetical protein AB5J52_17265 [Streptomyces sp. R39]|uniref:ParB/Sulfiredoxin domain-containing protein n=1 Tax=Streptomyces sp. R39 TaxID=3238631 RepID=A0AB39QKM8_9ACTN
MDLDDFATRFRSDIRAQLDWACLAKVHTRVRVEVLTRDAAKRRLADLFTVWYADPAGANSSWDAPDSRPLSVAAAARTLPSWPEERRNTVTALTQAFAVDTEPLRLMLPAYRVDERRCVLLDGNHRAVAAHRADADVHLSLCSLSGPACESILPDLRHYAAPLS